jgi:hypothetical protein
MTNEELIILLKKWDRHLWGINATYKDAAKLIGLDKPGRIKKVQGDRVMEPTEEGKKRFEFTLGYYDEIPCTCTDNCPDPCKGECGCSACRAAYCDSLDYS